MLLAAVAGGALFDGAACAAVNYGRSQRKERTHQTDFSSNFAPADNKTGESEVTAETSQRQLLSPRA